MDTILARQMPFLVGLDVGMIFLIPSLSLSLSLGTGDTDYLIPSSQPGEPPNLGWQISNTPLGGPL